MFEQNRLSDDRTSAAWHEDFGHCGREMDKQDNQVAHPDIVAIRASATRLRYLQDLCDKSGIRHRHVARLSKTLTGPAAGW
jgi:hypothetical protein